MPITFTVAQQEVARTIGAQGDADQLAAAATAIQMAMREMNQRNSTWNFKFAEATVAVTSGEGVVANAKRIHSVRGGGTSDPRTLQFIRPREWDRAIKDPSGLTTSRFYTVIEDSAGAIKIRVYPTEDGNYTVRYYADIVIPSSGGTNLDVPDRYLATVIALSCKWYLANRDAENARLAVWASEGEKLLAGAISDDQEHPDEDLALADWQDFRGGYQSTKDALSSWNLD